MDSNFDDYAFHRKIAMYNISFATLLAFGGVLFAAGIAFSVTGATEINHSIDVQGESQNRMVTAGLKFIGSGLEDLMLGLLLIGVSNIVFLKLIKRIPSPTQSRIDKLENTQQSNQSDLLKTNQQEEEIKNVKIRLDIENLRVELADLKLEVAALKLKEIKNKTNTNNPKKGRIGKKSNQ